MLGFSAWRAQRASLASRLKIVTAREGLPVSMVGRTHLHKAADTSEAAALLPAQLSISPQGPEFLILTAYLEMHGARNGEQPDGSVSTTDCLSSASERMMTSQSLRVAARRLGKINMLSVGVRSSPATSLLRPPCEWTACVALESVRF